MVRVGTGRSARKHDSYSERLFTSNEYVQKSLRRQQKECDNSRDLADYVGESGNGFYQHPMQNLEKTGSVGHALRHTDLNGMQKSIGY